MVISTRNLNHLSQRLRSLGNEYIPDELEALTWRALSEAGRVAKTYEAAPKASYHRTGDMSRSTAAFKDREPGVIGGGVRIGAPYGKWVRGDPQTGYPGAYMHKFRWTSLERIVANAWRGVSQSARDAIRRAARRAGIGV